MKGSVSGQSCLIISPREVCSWGGFQAPVPPDQMAHIRSQCATRCPLWEHVLDLSQPEQLIHQDLLGRPPRLITPQLVSIEAARPISSFCWERVASRPRRRSVYPGDQSQTLGWGYGNPALGLQTWYCFLRGWSLRVWQRPDCLRFCFL